jgi:hypothetical protein
MRFRFLQVTVSLTYVETRKREKKEKKKNLETSSTSKEWVEDTDELIDGLIVGRVSSNTNT